MTGAAEYLPASFRDRAGRLFSRDGRLYRQVNRAGAEDFAAFVDSGLYRDLLDARAIIPHQSVDIGLAIEPDIAVEVLEPQLVPYLSWPYEWCFRQLQDAALLTLDIQLMALQRGMILKDASAYNIQFVDGRPLLIDTLSFATYRDGQPWYAYRQFCQHFLAPLALMSWVDPRLAKLLRDHIDGIPLDLAVKLLPRKAFFRYGLFAHLYLHARSQQQHSDDARGGAVKRASRISQTALSAMISGLRRTVARMSPPAVATEWQGYYEETNYSEQAMAEKIEVIERIFTGLGRQGMVIDLGANTGRFSRLAASYADVVIAQDIDHNAIDELYGQLKSGEPAAILPLVQDLANPSPGLGWAQSEREGLLQRGEVDVLLALALIHHLAIGNNLPLDSIMRFFAALARHVIVEFVPRGDSQVDRMLATREDIFDDYSAEHFEAAAAPLFEVEAKQPLAGSERVIYHLRRK